jgi:hypothetical protein
MGFPHSEISGSLLFIQLPEAYRRYHVLLRLLMPRHPSAALSSLIIKIFFCYLFAYFPYKCSLCEDILPQALFFISDSFLSKSFYLILYFLEVSYLSFL